MPDEWGNPYEPGTPEHKQFLDGMMRAIKIPAQSALAGLDSLAQPPGPEVNPGPIEQYIPGLVSRVGGGIASGVMSADQLFDWATRGAAIKALNATGLTNLKYNIPETPKILTRLNELGDSSRKQAEALVKPTQPENAVEQVLSDVGDQVGLMAVPVPGELLKALPLGVQKIANPLAHVIAPLATEHKFMPFGAAAGITAGTEAIDDNADTIGNAFTAAKDAVTSGASSLYNTVTGQGQPQPVPQSEYPLPTPPVPPAQPPALGIQKPAEGPKITLGASMPPAPQLGIQPPATPDTTPPATPDSGTPNPDLTPQTGESGMTIPAFVGGMVGLGTFAGGFRGARRAMHAVGVPGVGEVPETGPGSRYAARKQEFEQSAQFQRNPQPQMKQQPQAPLMVNPIDILGLKAQTWGQDETALARAHFENSAQLNADVANTLGSVRNPDQVHSRNMAFFETGEHKLSGTQNIPLQETSLKYGRLDEDQKDVFNRAAYAANELDYRRNTGNPYSPEARRTLYNTDTPTLEQWISDGTRDPAVNSVLSDMWQTVGVNNMDIARRMGYPTTDIARIAAQHPHYLPTPGPDQTPMHVFSERINDPYSGPAIPTTPAFDLYAEHQDQLMKKFETDRLNRMLIDSDQYAQRMNPNHASMFTPSTDATGAFVKPTSQDSVTIPRRNGWETYKINNDAITRVMRAPSPAVKRAYLSAIRGYYTKLTTGPAAMAAGKFFAGTHGLVRGPYVAQINAPPDSYATLSNRLYRRAGGNGRLGNFLTRLVPDLYAATPGVALKSIGDRATHAVSNMLMPDANNRFNRILRNTWGDRSINQLRQRMINHYNSSVTADWRAAGGSGSGAAGTVFAPSYMRTSLNDIITHNPNAVLAPRAVTATSPIGKRMPLSVNLNNLIHDVFGAFMEAPNMTHFILNKDNPAYSPERLINESRAIMGDPGKMGSSSISQAANRNLAYTNAAVQDFARSQRAQAEAPMTRLLTRSLLLGSAAGASLYTAMHTPGGLSHLLNLVSTGQATSPIIYNGKDTDSTMQWSLPQTDRYVYPMHLDILAHAVGAWEAHHSEPAFQRMYHMLSDMFSGHVWNNTITATEHGATQQFDPLTTLPPGMSDVVEALGVQPRLELDRIIDRKLRGRPFQPGTSYIPRGAPGEEADSSLLGNRLEHTISAMTGLGANLIETLDRGWQSYKHDEGVGMAVHRMLDNLSQHTKDQNTYGNNVLWSTDTRLSSNSPLAEDVHKSLDVMRDTLGTKTDVNYQGVTRKGGPAISGMADRKYTNDPDMERMRSSVNQIYNEINKIYTPKINDIMKLDRDLSNIPMDEATRREKHNEYMRELNATYVPVAEIIESLNDHLSHTFGRRINMSSGVNWKGTMDQFKPLN